MSLALGRLLLEIRQAHQAGVQCSQAGVHSCCMSRQHALSGRCCTLTIDHCIVKGHATAMMWTAPLCSQSVLRPPLVPPACSCGSRSPMWPHGGRHTTSPSRGATAWAWARPRRWSDSQSHRCESGALETAADPWLLQAFAGPNAPLTRGSLSSVLSFAGYHVSHAHPALPTAVLQAGTPTGPEGVVDCH